MRVTGGGQLVGDYLDVELEADDLSLGLQAILRNYFPEGSKIGFLPMRPGVNRAIVWRPSPCDVQGPSEPEIASTTAHPGTADERLRDGNGYQVVWARDGLAEVRFDEDGSCYIIRWEGGR